MLDLIADILFDVLVPSRWKNRCGEVDARWFLLGFLAVAAVVIGLVFGVLYLMGVH